MTGKRGCKNTPKTAQTKGIDEKQGSLGERFESRRVRGSEDIHIQIHAYMYKHTHKTYYTHIQHINLLYKIHIQIYHTYTYTSAQTHKTYKYKSTIQNIHINLPCIHARIYTSAHLQNFYLQNHTLPIHTHLQPFIPIYKLFPVCFSLIQTNSK